MVKIRNLNVKFNDDEEVITVQQQNNFKKNNYDLNKNLKFSAKLRFNKIKLTPGKDQFVPAMISVLAQDDVQLDTEIKASLSQQHQIQKEEQGKEQAKPDLQESNNNNNNNNQQNNNSERTPIDIVCVIDHSGSMQGQKIELVKESLKQLIPFLNENDRFCIVQFDNNAERLTPLLRVNQKNIPTLISVINKITAQGGTDITYGMQVGMEVLKQRRFLNPITSIFLLSDGQDRSSEFGVKKLIETIQIKGTYSIQTFGYGADHDPVLMDKLSKDGNFIYVERLEVVDEAFIGALAGIMSVIGQNMEIKVENLDPSKFYISKTYGDYWQLEGSNEMLKIIKLLHLVKGQSKEFMLEIKISKSFAKIDNNQTNNNNNQDQQLQQQQQQQQLNPDEQQQKSKRELPILKLSMKIQDNDNKWYEIQKILSVDFYNPDEEVIGLVEDKGAVCNYFRVQAAEALSNARQFSDNGKYDKGQQVIQEVQDQYKNNQNIKEDPQFQKILVDLDNVKKQLQPNQYGAQQQQQLTNLNKAHMNQQAQMFGNFNNNSNVFQQQQQQQQYCNNLQQNMINYRQVHKQYYNSGKK